jgi:hypothetical protein
LLLLFTYLSFILPYLGKKHVYEQVSCVGDQGEEAVEQQHEIWFT